MLLSLVITAVIAEVAALVPLGVQEMGWEKHKAPRTGTAAHLSTGATQEVSMLLEYQHSNNQRSWLNTTGAPLCFPPPSQTIVQPFQQHVSLADAPGERHWAAVCSYPGTSGQWIWKAACWVKVAAAFLMMGSTEERTEVDLWQPHTTEESGYSLLRVIYSPALGVTSVSFRCSVWNSVSFLLTFQRLLADSSSSARVTHTL